MHGSDYASVAMVTLDYPPPDMGHWFLCAKGAAKGTLVS